MGNTLPVVLHIPHSGNEIPAEYRGDFLLDDAALHREMGVEPSRQFTVLLW